ncbi:hypothetical protein D9756_006179 [Leucocoprinus leucothites]|uniref:Ribosomal eL28/Mak16 domain-containing protein n=1 Tax=Leucocoprinus leucothites TaxID=201217 RepID=A0A8H5D2N0_9AGAR|nr:hypothetical protein D9756_006179 [Leucoagaricus leucothites]
MSTDLQWLLLRQNNSHIVKRVPEGPVFSKEPGNLRNLHSHKYSGLANSKTIDISESNGSINIVTRKSKASPHAVASAHSTSPVRPRSGGRRALGVAAGVAKRGYRPDLRTGRINPAAPCRYRTSFDAPREGTDSLAHTHFLPGMKLSTHPTHFYPLSVSVNTNADTSLRQAALARVSALLAAHREPKPTPPRKARGKKAKAAASS